MVSLALTPRPLIITWIKLDLDWLKLRLLAKGWVLAIGLERCFSSVALAYLYQIPLGTDSWASKPNDLETLGTERGN